MHPASNSNMAPQRSQLLTAIQNVQFLLAFNASRWILSSSLRSSSSSSSLNRRRLSFRSQPSGLLDCCSADDEYYEAGSSFVHSRSTSLATAATSRSTSPASDIARTTSGASSLTDDIDRRAEEFIDNFYRHIQMERQVSLELRCSKGKDLERTRSQ